MTQMKHLKSSYQDLHRIFRHSITAREIAEPLASFEKDHTAAKVRKFLEERNFDVVGIRNEGVITGYALRESLASGVVGDHLLEFKASDVINESDPLLDTLEALKSSRWVFIRFLGNPSGIVTRGDLQKAPMRMWLFGLISLLEMQVLRLIRAAYPNDEWVSCLSPQRRGKANTLYLERQRRNDAIDLAECLQIGDKRNIFSKSEKLQKIVGFMSKTEWVTMMKDIEKLRDKLAHSNGIESASWPKHAQLISQMENCLLKLEKATV